ncbi:MAG: enoyl-CoA hydratase/isomerase family protein, partial [Aestuariibacter sp.]|nr:enoyl-CoA hydratase/isomerase family protein [Aestuariibacter sp.]
KTSLVAPPVPTKLSFIENKERSFSEGYLKKPADISLVNSRVDTIEKGSSFETTKETSPVILSNSPFESSSRERRDPVPSSVSLYDYRKGVFLIQISKTETKTETQNTLSESMIQELLQAFRKIQEAEEVKVLILAGTDQCFLAGGRRQQNEAIKQKLHEEIASFPFPVIAAMKGDALGVGFLVGALCDFMICSQEG